MNENFNAMISTLQQSATDTQEKMNSYVKSDRVYTDATHEIQKEYHDKLKILEQKFNEDRTSLSEIKDAKINSIDKTEYEENEQIANTAQMDFRSVFSQLKQSFNINNDQMCQILQNQTGLQWKFLPVVGKPVFFHQSGCVPLHPYGMLLVNENDENFDNEAYYTGSNDVGGIVVPQSETCYPGSVGASSDENANAKLENFNWGHLYLYSKVRQTQKEINENDISKSEENNEVAVVSHKDISYSLVDHDIISLYEYRPTIVELVTSAIDSEFNLVKTNPVEETTQLAPSFAE